MKPGRSSCGLLLFGLGAIAVRAPDLSAVKGLSFVESLKLAAVERLPPSRGQGFGD